MPLAKFSTKVKETPSHRLARQLDSFIRSNRSFRNLDKDNQKVLLEILKDYRLKSRRGRSITSIQVRRDMNKLSSQRVKLGLSRIDLADIRKILNAFVG